VLNFKRIISVIALLLVVLLQGVGGALAAVQCPAAEAGAAHSSNSGDGLAQERGDDTVDNFSEHLFCHQLSSAMPVMPAAIATLKSPEFRPSVPIVSSQFFPEQPQRPPFAAGV
jgi:hypothetical protein